MKKRAIEIGCDLFLSFHNHCVVVALLVTFIGACGYHTPYFGLWMSLWSIPVYLYITRKNVRNFYMFFVVQFLPVAAVCMIKVSIGIKLLVLFVTVLYVISSIRIRLTEIPEELTFPPIVSIGVLGVTYILEDVLLKRNWGNYYLFLAFAYVIVYFFQLFLERYINFVLVNKISAGNIPEREMLVSGMKQTIAYVACGVTIMLLSINVEWLSFLLGIIGRGIRVIMRFLFSLLKQDLIVETEIIKEAQSGGGGGVLDYLEAGEAHPFWVFMDKVAMIAFFIGMAVLIVKGVIKGYQYLRIHFGRVEKSHHQVQSGLDVRESCEIERGGGERLRLFSFLSNTEKIRRMYRKRVLKSKALIVGEAASKELEYLTAKECCDKLSADTLKGVYEKARYSNEAITSDDVRNVKISIKKDM